MNELAHLRNARQRCSNCPNKTPFGDIRQSAISARLRRGVPSFGRIAANSAVSPTRQLRIRTQVLSSGATME